MCTECTKAREAQAAKAGELVIQGIGLLNEKLPRDWSQHINRDELDIANSEDCVIGQLSRWLTAVELMDAAGVPSRGSFGYDRLAGYLGIRDRAHEYGFDSHPEAYMGALNMAWGEAIEALQSA